MDTILVFKEFSGFAGNFHCGVYCGVLRKTRGFWGHLRDMDRQESLIFTGGTGW